MKWLLGSIAALALMVIGYATFQALSLGSSWASVDRVALDAVSTTSTATGAPVRRSLPSIPVPDGPKTTTGPAAPTATPFTATPTTMLGRHQLDDTATAPSVMALIGSDSRAGLEDIDDYGDFPGRRADAIVLVVRDGEQVGLMSVPRDLYVADLCNGGRHRIGEALRGCGETSGLAHLLHELENVTGLDIEHVVAVDLAGFQEVIDAIGGYEICTEYALRDRKSGLDLEAGCTVADGETTLQWLRSRRTERLVDGSWKREPGVSDLARNNRQRQVLAGIFERVASRNSPGDILEVARAVAPHLTIDDQLSLTDAVSWLWDYRTSEVSTTGIPVAYERAESGASILVPTVDVEDFAAGIPS